jgi:hypothetical protein
MAGATFDYSSFSGASRLLIEASGTSDTASYHSKITKRIKELEQEALRISQEIGALKTCRNAAGRTNRLPPEVLAHIFSYVSKFHTCIDILHVAHVCRRWRLIVLDHPQFFAYLQGSTILDSEALTCTMIRMSNEAPISLTWTGAKGSTDSKWPPNLNALLSATYHKKLKSLVFWKTDEDEYKDEEEDPEEDTFSLSEAFCNWYDPESCSPMLEKLSIMNIVIDDYYKSGGMLPDTEELESGHLKQTMFIRDHTLLKGGAPALRDMTLSHIGLAWKGLPFGPSLVHLNLLEDHRFGKMCRPTTSEFIDTLKQMPRLETIKLHNLLPTIGAHGGEVFMFPPTLRSLRVTDNSKSLFHFLQIARVLDHVEVTVAFFRCSIDTRTIGKVLTHFKKAIGENRARASAAQFVDHAGLSFKVWFDDRKKPERPQYLENYLAPVRVTCSLGPTPILEPEEYYSVLTQHFDLSRIHTLRLVSADLTTYEDDAWSFFAQLPKLDTLFFRDTHFAPFIHRLKPHESSSSTEDAQAAGGRQCAFPALKVIVGASPSHGPAFQGRDRRAHTSVFIDVLKERKQLGYPLHKVDFTESEMSEEVAAKLRDSVPGLAVHRSADSEI